MLLDTNVLVSALLFGGLPRQLVDRVLTGDVELVSSRALLDELEDVLLERFGYQRAAARATRTEFEDVAVLVEPGAVPAVSRDPDDDVVLATAVAGCVTAIVTGDRDPLVLVSHRGIPVVTPPQFTDGQREFS